MADRESLALEVPADPSFVGTARMFASASGRMLGVSEESIEDLKVAISEGCTAAIEAQKLSSGSEHPMRIDIFVVDGALDVKISHPLGIDDPSGGGWDPKTPTHLFQRTLGVGLIHALFPQAKWDESSEKGLRLSLTVPRSDDPVEELSET